MRRLARELRLAFVRVIGAPLLGETLAPCLRQRVVHLAPQGRGNTGRSASALTPCRGSPRLQETSHAPRPAGVSHESLSCVLT